MVYSLSQKIIDSDNVLKNCLFGAIKVTKPGDTTDTDRFIGVDLSNSVHATNDKQNILILGHGLNQKVNDTTIYAEKMYSPNFSAENKIF